MANDADFLSLSTLPTVSALGKSMQKRKATELALKNRNPINLGNGVLYNPNTKSSEVSTEYQDMIAQKRQQEMDLANAKLQRTNDNKIATRDEKRSYDEGRDAIQREQELADRDYKAEQKLKPSSKSTADMNAMQNAINDGADMIAMLDENPDTISQWGDIPSSFLRTVGADTASNLLESYTSTPEELSVKQRLNSFVAEIRKRLSGSALTNMEKSLGSSMFPAESGISQSIARERLRNIIKYMEGEQNLNKERYGMAQEEIDPRVAPEQQPSKTLTRIQEIEAQLKG